MLKEGFSSVLFCWVFKLFPSTYKWRCMLNFRTDNSDEGWKHCSYFSGYCRCYYHHYHHRYVVPLRVQVCYIFVLIIFSPNRQDPPGELSVCGNSFLFADALGDVFFWKSSSHHDIQISLICELILKQWS